MIRVTWSWDDIKREISTGISLSPPESSNFFGYTNLHLLIDGVDIIGGAYTPIVHFFGFSFSALSTLDPSYFHDRVVRFRAENRNFNCVYGAGFQFCLHLHVVKSAGVLQVTYESAAGSKAGILAIPVRSFVTGLIESYRQFDTDLIGMYPAMCRVRKIRWLEEDAGTIKDWCTARFPRDSPIP